MKGAAAADWATLSPEMVIAADATQLDYEICEVR